MPGGLVHHPKYRTNGRYLKQNSETWKGFDEQNKDDTARGLRKLMHGSVM
jgi:hypothetical protein